MKVSDRGVMEQKTNSSIRQNLKERLTRTMEYACALLQKLLSAEILGLQRQAPTHAYAAERSYSPLNPSMILVLWPSFFDAVNKDTISKGRFNSQYGTVEFSAKSVDPT